MDRDEIAAFLRKLQGFGGHRTTVIALRLRPAAEVVRDLVDETDRVLRDPRLAPR